MSWNPNESTVSSLVRSSESACSYAWMGALVWLNARRGASEPLMGASGPVGKVKVRLRDSKALETWEMAATTPDRVRLIAPDQ